jgi:ketosteroid isomerase-like protein
MKLGEFMSNVERVRQVDSDFAAGEVEQVLGAMHPQIEWRGAEGNPYQSGGPAWIGPEAVVQNLFVPLGSDRDGFTTHPKEFHDAGDTVVVEARYTGTHKETGKPLDAQVCHVWRVADGMLTSFQQYVDIAQMQDVTGKR